MRSSLASVAQSFHFYTQSVVLLKNVELSKVGCVLWFSETFKCLKIELRHCAKYWEVQTNMCNIV